MFSNNTLKLSGTCVAEWRHLTPATKGGKSSPAPALRGIPSGILDATPWVVVTAKASSSSTRIQSTCLQRNPWAIHRNCSSFGLYLVGVFTSKMFRPQAGDSQTRTTKQKSVPKEPVTGREPAAGPQVSTPQTHATQHMSMGGTFFFLWILPLPPYLTYYMFKQKKKGKKRWENFSKLFCMSHREADIWTLGGKVLSLLLTKYNIITINVIVRIYNSCCIRNVYNNCDHCGPNLTKKSLHNWSLVPAVWQSRAPVGNQQGE